MEHMINNYNNQNNNFKKYIKASINNYNNLFKMCKHNNQYSRIKMLNTSMML